MATSRPSDSTSEQDRVHARSINTCGFPGIKPKNGWTGHSRILGELLVVLISVSACWARTGNDSRQEAAYYVAAYAPHYNVPVEFVRAVVELQNLAPLRILSSKSHDRTCHHSDELFVGACNVATVETYGLAQLDRFGLGA